MKENNAGGEGHADADIDHEKGGIDDVGAEGPLEVARGLGGEKSSGQAAVTGTTPGGAPYAAAAIEQQSKPVPASPGEIFMLKYSFFKTGYLSWNSDHQSGISE